MQFKRKLQINPLRVATIPTAVCLHGRDNLYERA